MKLWKIALFVLAATVSSCGTHIKKPKIQITHVLAVTEQGDTLRLPINMIKPNVYYNIVSYPSYPRYYSNWYNEGYYRHRSEIEVALVMTLALTRLRSSLLKQVRHFPEAKLFNNANILPSLLRLRSDGSQ